MTMAVFRTRGTRLEAEISGHALYAESGRDIVCAACSILVCALRESLARMEAAGEITELCEEKGEGRVKISCVCASEAEERTRAAFEVAINGFKLLNEGYPENVRCIEQ